MFGRALGTMVVGAALLAGAHVANAQTSTTPPTMGQTPTLDSCRDEAIRRGISGDRLSAFLTQCMSQPSTGMPAQRASLERCRSEAISRNLVGDARYTYIDDCMGRSGSAVNGSGDGTYGYCRSQARARGLSGTQLDQFLDQCVAK